MSITAQFNEDLHQYEVKLDGVPVAHLPNVYMHGAIDVEPSRREKTLKGIALAFGEAFDGISVSDLEKETSSFFSTPSEAPTAKSKTQRGLQTLGYIPNAEGVKVPFIHPGLLENAR